MIKLLYPKVCGICKRVSKQYVCAKCMYNLKKIEKNKIEQMENKFFKEYAYIFEYNGIIRDRLIEYKFLEESYLYKSFAEYILKNKKISDFIKKYDIIIPVPVHKKRKRQRGYNQTELIAQKIAQQLNISCETKILIKIKNTKPQSTLNKEEREINAKSVYLLKNKEILTNKKVLLMDDIYTTGSTVNECCHTLYEASPKEIGVMTIAKD